MQNDVLTVYISKIHHCIVKSTNLSNILPFCTKNSTTQECVQCSIEVQWEFGCLKKNVDVSLYWPTVNQLTVWRPAAGLEKCDLRILRNFYLSKKIEKKFQFFTHTVWENLKKSLYHSLYHTLSFKTFNITTVCCCIHNGVMYSQIFHWFYTFLRNIWKRQVQDQRNIRHFFLTDWLTDWWDFSTYLL
jgi:hypothetical protein